MNCEKACTFFSKILHSLIFTINCKMTTTATIITRNFRWWDGSWRICYNWSRWHIWRLNRCCSCIWRRWWCSSRRWMSRILIHHFTIRLIRGWISWPCIRSMWEVRINTTTRSQSWEMTMRQICDLRMRWWRGKGNTLWQIWGSTAVHHLIFMTYHMCLISFSTLPFRAWLYRLLGYWMWNCTCRMYWCRAKMISDWWCIALTSAHPRCCWRSFRWRSTTSTVGTTALWTMPAALRV